MAAIFFFWAAVLPAAFGLALLGHVVPSIAIHHFYELFKLTHSGWFDLCLAGMIWGAVFLLKLAADRLKGRRN